MAMMNTAQKLLEEFKSPKTLPQVAMRISALVADEKCTISQLDGIIRMDPILVVRLLQLINSPYYGLRENVDNIPQAIVFLGMNSLRNMVILEAAKEIFRGNASDAVFSKSKLWFHCVSVAICSQMISERIFSQNGENAFLCGILHDTGFIVENQVVPDAFLQVLHSFANGDKPIILYENKIIGTNHCLIGSQLARQWNLSLEIQEGIKHHHSDLKEISPFCIAAILQIAEHLVACQGYPALPGMEPLLSPVLVKHVDDHFDEYQTLIGDLPVAIQKARELYL